MARFLLRRLLLTIPVIIGIIFVTFVLVRSIPGDPCRAMLGEKATQESCAQFKQRFGLNDNIFVQFTSYTGNLLSGDLGQSIKFGRPVGDMLLERLPLTLELTIGAMTFAILVGVPLGILAAYRRKSVADAATMVVANLGVSMPIFWLGLLLAGFFGLVLKDTPFQLPTSSRLTAGLTLPPLIQLWNLQGLEGFPRGVITFISNMFTLNALITWNMTAFWDAVKHLILPSIALGTIPMAIIARLTRSNLLDVMGLDYIRTARAKGLGQRLILFRHAMRNALLPLVTVVGLQFGGLLGGAVLTESVFGLQGVGVGLVDSIFVRDYPVVQGFTLIIALIFVFVNLMVDISYAYLDPRIRLG
ncbi:MAG TPA: ABC transporter permease [Chloroflexia bacterium]|nr:ABC transporter permease [Chloroflexia bacterium]